MLLLSYMILKDMVTMKSGEAVIFATYDRLSLGTIFTVIGRLIATISLIMGTVSTTNYGAAGDRSRIESLCLKAFSIRDLPPFFRQLLTEIS